MGNGILVCGLNGAGKSTLGHALAQRIGYYFIDNEDLYFPKNDENYLFASPRTKLEVKSLLTAEIAEHENFVFASVIGNYGDDVISMFNTAVVIDAPKDIRLRRIKERSLSKFGDRMLPGGDLYEAENAFFDMVSGRDEGYVEDWLEILSCPVIRVDGTLPIEQNIERIINEIYPEKLN